MLRLDHSMNAVRQIQEMVLASWFPGLATTLYNWAEVVDVPDEHCQMVPKRFA